VAQESPDNVALPGSSVGLEGIGRKQIHHNVVIISSIKRNIAPRFGHGAYDIQCLVTVKRRNLDGNNVLDLCELAPESVREHTTAHGRLQIKTK
jgi:hypothetical protein